MYLTFTEYEALGYDDVTEENYTRLANAAKDTLDHLTRDFYVWNSLADDVEFRRDKFKRANAAMIHYYAQHGTTDSFALNNSGSVTIGRTSISNANTNSGIPAPREVYQLLAYTGLLYKGLGGAYGC